MNNISIKSNWIIGILALFSIGAFVIAEYSKIFVEKEWYEEKLNAAIRADSARKILKKKRIGEAIFIDAVNDPNETALIGQRNSQITTDHGSLSAKLSSTNPNFAAVIVEMFKKAEIKEGDYVAVGLTGSFPGLNIALYAAIEELRLRPIIISSVGSSDWGANDPYFTWLDMERTLFENGLFSNTSVAASYGGGHDIGRGLSPDGRSLILESIKRNNLMLIHEEFLEKSIEKRMEIYDKLTKGNQIKAYVNVGGGLASLGSSINGDLIPSGLSMQIPMRNYPVHGVIIQMAERKIPIIHLLNIHNLLTKYGLEDSPSPLPKPGQGDVFKSLRYNVTIVGIVTFILILIISIVIYLDRKYNKLGADNVEVPNDKEHEGIEI